MRLIYAAALVCVFQLASALAIAQDTDQEPRLTHTSPELERRDRAVTQEDVEILIRAEEILADESTWNREDDRICSDDESAGQWSLFCALQKASTEVLGVYDHRRVALQEVRFAIADMTDGREFAHRQRNLMNVLRRSIEITARKQT